MGFIFQNPSLRHKWERRFMGNFLNNSGTTDGREGKYDWNLSRGLLNTSSMQMSTVADKQHNTIKLITLKPKIKIQPYLPAHFLLLISQTHSSLIVPLLHSVSDMTVCELILYRYASLNDGDTFWEMCRWVIPSLCKLHRAYLHKPRQYSIAYYKPRLYGIAYCC
jgi:hypothetical protein